MLVSSTLQKDGDRYELLGELASGGMATVYLARMRRPMGFSRLVAIKCMHPQFAKDPSFVSMFMDEARLTARLRHPNIVPTLDIVADDGHLLLVMEYVEGASLAHLLRAARTANVRIPVPIACAIVHDLLLGLHEAHQAKDDDDGAPLSIIHRDVSPQNVLVGLDGLSRVLDFGVAKARQNTHHSNDNEIKGKIPYMPPEQLFGESIDHKVDVYAAGVTLWEALVCERLFEGPSETALVRKISEEPIASPRSKVAEIPAELDAIVMRALAREATDRFDSALSMAQALAGVVQLPTRTEVSAWVRQFITPREIPSGNKLPASAVSDSATTKLPSRPSRVEAAPTTTILAILEKASMLRPSAKRPKPAPLPSRSRFATRLAIGVAAVAMAVAGVAVARSAKNDAPAAVVAHVTTTSNEQALGTTLAATHRDPAPSLAAHVDSEEAPAVTPAPAPQPAPARVTSTRSATARASTPKIQQPTLAIAAQPAAAHVDNAAPGPQPAPVAVADTKSKDCRIPFTIDENGQKHYKVECL